MSKSQQPELPALPESVIRRIHDREAFIPDMVGLRDLWPEILKFGNAVAQAAVLADRERREEGCGRCLGVVPCKRTGNNCAIEKRGADQPDRSDKNAQFADWMLHGIEISGEAADGFKLNAAVRDVLVERQRQISIEGWSTEHDDRYKSGELASASAAYSAAAAEQISGWDGEMIPPRWWPWDPLWWRPSDPRRNLVKSVALGLAEIQRMDRAAAPSKVEDKTS